MRFLIAAIAMLLVAAVLATVPVAADPPPKVQFSAELTGTSVTTYPDASDPNLFHQETTFDVNGRFRNKAMTGTLHQEYHVRLRGADLPPELPGPYILVDPDAPPPDQEYELVQTATLETNLGDLSWDTAPYNVSHIGFECLPPLSNCVRPDAERDNASILVFGQGTGVFDDASLPDLWTMRVERHGPATGDVTGSLSGGVGRAFRYCATGQLDTTASTGSGTYETAVSLATENPDSCRDELGNPVNNSLEGGPLQLDFRFNWDFVGVNRAQPLYPDVSATASNGSVSTMTGMTSSAFLLGPGFRHGIALGGQGGEIDGVYAKYPYVYLDLAYNLSGPFDTIVGTHTVDGDITGIVAVYDDSAYG